MKDQDYKVMATALVATVSQNPTEEFSLERRWIVERITIQLAQFVAYAESEFQQSFDVGYEEGYAKAGEEYEEEIQDLCNRIEDLERELEDTEEIDRAFAEGFETGQQHPHGVDSIELS